MNDETQLPPALRVRQLALVMRASRALYAAASLGIADILAGGPQSSGEVAAKAGSDALTMRRLLRSLVAHGVFAEESPDRFRLNACGELLRSDVPESLLAGVLFTAGNARWDMWSDFLESVRTGQAASERAFGKDIFQHFAEDAAESELFNRAMTSFSAALSAPVIAAYDFSPFACIADVGGGKGRFLTDILIANPAVRGILFDLPHVVAGIALTSQAKVAERCSVVAGDFFAAVPAGASAYLLKQVIHDWDDARALAILKSCREAMTPAARLLIVERVMPARAEQGRSPEAYLLDLEMLVMTPGGRERTETDFRGLVAAAGLRVTRIVPTRSPVSVIEAQPI
jgi:hypothetical protein